MAMVKKTPQKKIGGRRNQTLIQSPVVKRVLSTPVTLQGWLQKRGSDGLMLWKKRWFVLSDYCLFYYKDSEEEKVLGSFILPSYKISPCSNDDKIYKKYSFKAEHNNMRTYYFAADNDVLMSQWVKALTLASLLQETPGPLVKGSTNQSSPGKSNVDHYAFGDYQYGAPSDTGLGTNSNSSDNQPLYANAPPKPKRLNDAPSPDCSPDLQTHEDRDLRNSFSHEWSHPNIYYKSPNIPHIAAINMPSFEKKTPESYSRNLYQPGNLQMSESYQRNNAPQSSPMEHYQHLQCFSSNQKVLNNHPPRPHSVDFLDYEAKQPSEATAQKESKLITLPRRPKSSLSILSPKDETLDSIHWSEESYAKKMRQSSMYVRSPADNTPTGFARIPQNKRRVNLNSSNHEGFNNDSSSETNQEALRIKDDNGDVDPSFKRSASARLPDSEQHYHSHNKNSDNNSDNQDEKKTQQREESMKRLLEWKQRMLQSPLTQKSPRQSEYQKYSKEAPITVNLSSESIPKGSIPNNEMPNPNMFYSKASGQVLKKEVEFDSAKPQMELNYSAEKGLIKRDCVSYYKEQLNTLDSRPKEVFRDADSPRESQMTLRKSEEDSGKSTMFQNIVRCYPGDKRITLCEREQLSANSSFDNTKPIYSNSIVESKSSTPNFDMPGDRKTLHPGIKPQPYNVETGEMCNEIDEEWGLKLDESRVIKEFSYHYIKCDNLDGIPYSNREIDMLQSNLKSRLRAYQIRPDESSLENQPSKAAYLKSSNHQLDENRSKPIKDKKNEEKYVPKAQPAPGILKNPKPMQKISRILDDNKKTFTSSNWDKESCSEFYDKRQVLSDTETLLYDTSSDVEDKHSICVSKQNVSSSDDDRDEEVAAVLAKERKLNISCQTPTQTSYTNSSNKNNMPAEKCSILEKHKKFQNSLTSDIKTVVQEENYMPMTPRRRPISASPPKDVEQSTLLHNSHRLSMEHVLDSVEECPYVEMTQNGKDKSRLLTKVSGTPSNSPSMSLKDNCDFDIESSTYIDLDSEKNMHYEMHVYNEMQAPEPLYMEVKDKNIIDQNFKTHDISSGVNFLDLENKDEEINDGHNVSTRASLPDILNTTAPSFNHGSGRSDSSDADDEASKDLDSIDAPRHPRFSLSDTFRPASYYLGSSLSERTIIAMNSDHPDSSDSDLVSPPPIPTSSPPLDDLDTSIDSTINNKEISPSVSKEEFETHFCRESKCTYVSCKNKNDIQNSSVHLDLVSSEEESIKSDKTDLFLKRRPLSADILNSFHEFSILEMPSSRDGKSSSDVESMENDKTKSIYQESDNMYFDQQQDLKVNKLIESQNCGYNVHSKEDFVMGSGEINNRMFSDIKRDQCLEASNVKTSDYTLKLNRNKPIPSSLYKSIKENQYNIKNGNVIPIVHDRATSSPGELYSSKSSQKHCEDLNDYINSSCSPSFSQDQQNTAPYYYSDLLKLDPRNNIYVKNMREFKESLHEDNLYPYDMYLQENPNVNQMLRENQPFINPKTVIDMNESPSGPQFEKSSTLRHINPSYRKYDLITNAEIPCKSQTINKSPLGEEEKSFELHNRSRSLEGLMDGKVNAHQSYPLTHEGHNVFPRPQIPLSQVMEKPEHAQYNLNAQSQRPVNLWDEDSLWRENMRKMSVRHTRSLEELDKKVEQGPGPPQPGPQQRTCEAVYVNSDFSRQANEIVHHRSSIDKDREKIRQWDLLSSAPATLSTSHIVNSTASRSKPSLTTKTVFGNVNEPTYSQTTQNKVTEQTVNIQPSTSNRHTENKQRGAWNLKLSAGELLGRTHEELVLLLIQLRRQRAGVCKSMERCHREIEAQACLTDFDATNRIEHLQRLEELKSQLAELEKQYEKGKPLVNLVDNMVKLGSLYQAGSQTPPSQKLEFNHKVQEQRILADERRDWERIRPDHQDLQAKVEQLYRLDKLLQEESGTLHSLQEDKGILERALGGLRNKLQGVHGNSAETEWYRRQQRLLERELSRVRSILALNSKKLEETVAENARLEQELVVIRQKLQLSRRTTEPGGATTAVLESELCRVQLLVGNLLRQRQELSLQVRQLTEKSHSLSQQIWPCSTVGVGNSANVRKKQSTCGWIETDLDIEASPSNIEVPLHPTRDHTNYISPLYVNTENVDKRTQHISDINNCNDESVEDMSPAARSPELYRQFETDDDGSKRPYGLAWKEKPQEIKTVRIVKRESERRQRDRDRSGNLGIPFTCISSKRAIPEEDQSFSCVEKSTLERSLEEMPIVHNEVLNEGPPPTPGPRSDSVNAVWNIVRKNKLKGNLVGGVHTADKEECLQIGSDSPQLSPVYLSEAARKIVEEVAWQGKGEKRLIPKEKRRHHTVSGPSIITPKNVYSQRGSRDDLDMERVLRPRLTTPDVVRSTLNRTDPNFTKETIDNILGAPGKIVIPERYIPESQPQLSKEELQKRSKKADAIRKMLCETATVSPKDTEVKEKPSSLKHKVEEEKRNREHLLQLSQMLAHEVMEKSKIVAVKALASLPLQSPSIQEDYDDMSPSPTSMLPLYQQRENFFS